MTTPGTPSAGQISRGWLRAVRGATLAAMALAAARAIWLLRYREIASLRPWILPAMLLDALAAFAVAVTAARAYSAARRGREDRRILLWGILLAGLYFALLRLLTRVVIPGNLPGILS